MGHNGEPTATLSKYLSISFDQKQKMALYEQVSEVSQNWLDQDLKHIPFHQATYLNRYFWFHPEEY